MVWGWTPIGGFEVTSYVFVFMWGWFVNWSMSWEIGSNCRRVRLKSLLFTASRQILQLECEFLCFGQRLRSSPSVLICDLRTSGSVLASFGKSWAFRWIGSEQEDGKLGLSTLNFVRECLWSYKLRYPWWLLSWRFATLNGWKVF